MTSIRKNALANSSRENTASTVWLRWTREVGKPQIGFSRPRPSLVSVRPVIFSHRVCSPPPNKLITASGTSAGATPLLIGRRRPEGGASVMTRRRLVIGRRMGGRSDPLPDLELVSAAGSQQCQLLLAGKTSRRGVLSLNYISPSDQPSTAQSAASGVPAAAANRTNYWCLIVFTERLACVGQQRAQRCAGVGGSRRFGPEPGQCRATRHGTVRSTAAPVEVTAAG